MAIKEENIRLAAIVSKELEQKVKELATQEKRTKSAMTAILIEKGLEEYKKM